MTIQEEAGGRSTITRHVIVPLGSGRSALIILEGPAARFESYQTIFAAALKAATFPR